MTSETHSHGWEKDTTREAHLQKKMILWTSGRIAIRACRPIALISLSISAQRIPICRSRLAQSGALPLWQSAEGPHAQSSY